MYQLHRFYYTGVQEKNQEEKNYLQRSLRCGNAISGSFDSTKYGLCKNVKNSGKKQCKSV
jgi:hypothetical protein